MYDDEIDGGAFGISTTVSMIDEILDHKKAWRRVLFEMYEQALNQYNLRLHEFDEDLVTRYRRMGPNSKAIFKQGVKTLYELLQTTTRKPSESSFDLRTMTLRKREKFYEDMEFLMSYGLRLV